MKAFKRFLIGLAIVLVALVGWGLAEPYFIDTEEHRARIPHLPSAWEGKRFAQISDWQLGMWMDNEATVRRSVERLVEARPAFVLISGDFIYHAQDDQRSIIQKVVDLARPLPEAGIPTFAVLGNHDYAMKKKDGTADEQLARRLEEALEEAGIDVLQNETRVLSAEASRPAGDLSAAPLHLVGIGANWPGKDRPQEAVAAVPDGAARIVMMHNPTSFEALPPGSAPLAVAGHTHGGQISIPFTPDWSYLTYAKSDVQADGWVTDDYGAPGNRLYVNRGIGFSGVPIRIHCMPEITMFTLVAGKKNTKRSLQR